MRAFVGGVIAFALPTHLLATVALALLAGQHARFPFLALVALAAGLVAGSLAIASGVGETPASTALLALAALGAAGPIIAWAIPAWITAGLAVAIGAALPLNAPPQEITKVDAVAAQAGLAVAALVAFAVIALIARGATRPWQRIGVRIVSSWIAASAILVLVLRLAR